MVKPLAVVVSCLALLQHTIAFDPANRRACDKGELCLTSFIWCGGVNGEPEGCAYPPDTYRFYDRGDSNRAALFLGNTYNLTWKNADSDYPVLIEWSFVDLVAETNVNGRWLKNVTGPYYELNFLAMSNEFPNPDWSYGNRTDVYTPTEVRGMAANIANNIVISQPERPSPNTEGVTYPYGYWADRSQEFAVLPGQTRRFFETAEERTADSLNRKWRLGVGIGVGIGVPLLLAAAFFGGWFAGKKRVGGKVENLRSEDKSGSSST